MAKYREIQEFVRARHGRLVKTCWIAHAKEIHGLRPRRSPVRSGERQEPCPSEKLAWIEDAFRYFRMIG